LSSTLLAQGFRFIHICTVSEKAPITFSLP
jgi:hypothetical protein